MDTVLFFTSELSPPVQKKLAGVYEAARKRGWTVRPIALNRSGRRPGDFIRLWKPLGILVECADANPFLGEPPPRLPTVWLDRDPAVKGGLAVNLDAGFSAELAARELLTAKSAALAFVGWHTDVWWSRFRRRRLAEAARREKLSFHSAPSGCWSPERYAGEDGALRDFLAALPARTGIFAANDLTAERVIASAAQLGRTIPGDFFVVGADDDLFLCENSAPALSSVAPDFRRLGEAGVELLARALDDGKLKKARLTVPPREVVRRESSRGETVLDARLVKAVEFIRREATRGISVPEVAAACGCSRRLLEIRFREILGHTVHDEIDDVRLARARELLSRPDQALGPIADLCGWNSPLAFRRLFRARYGLTPREWRSHPD